MSIAAFYRNWIPVVGKWTYFSGGRGEEVFTEFKYYKGNVQPFKDGFGVANTSSGVLNFYDYLLLYTKEEITFEPPPPEDIPADAIELALTFKWFYVNGKWYTVTGDENWTYAGKAPKHFKYSGQYQSGSDYVGGDVGDPIPIPDLVSEFESVISELNQMTNIIT